MKRLVRFVATLLTLGLLTLGSVFVDPAGAAPQPVCGGVVNQSVTLDADVGPCNTGIRIGRDDVHLNLNGHRIFCVANKQGEGAGVSVYGKSGVTIKNGIIEFCDAGILLQGASSGNTVASMLLRKNKTNGALALGDGIALSTTSNHRIVANTITNNGPFDGIALVGQSKNNVIRGNTVTDNSVPSTNFLGHPTIMQDDGIRIEGPGATDNTVDNNRVVRNGRDGISVFGAQGTGRNNVDNVISSNHIEANGFNNLNRQGNGIILFPDGNKTRVLDNTSVRNAANGIEVDSKHNVIRGNFATGNSAAGHPPPNSNPAFDLLDTNPGCDANVWSANLFGTAHPPCTTAP